MDGRGPGPLHAGARIRLLSLAHVGGDSRLKVLDFVPRDKAHMEDILAGGERADGSNLVSGMRAGSSDIVLKPRPRAAFLDPFSPVPTLVVLCRHADREGNPLPQSPDTIVRKAADRVQQELGIELWALGEVEFFLGGRRGRTTRPGGGTAATTPPRRWSSGRNSGARRLCCWPDWGCPPATPTAKWA